MTSAPTDDLVTTEEGFYPALAESMLSGRLDLGIAPSAELLQLPDPYDPAANEALRLHDASLFDGRYFIYFGLTPVVVLFIPARALGIPMSEPLAAAVFASLALAFATLLLLMLVRRFVPRAPTWMIAVGILTLGFGTGVPFLLRRPAVYEVAIASGLCFAMLAALAGFWASTAKRYGNTALAVSWLATGLAVGSRPHLILVAAIPVWASARRLRRRASNKWLVIAATTPFIAVVTLLLSYNAARFGSPLEFGGRYQLAGINVSAYDTFALPRILPGIFFYYLALPTLTSTFPFVLLDPSWPGGGLPSSFIALEKVAGVLPMTPIIAIGAGLAVWGLWARRRSRSALRGWLTAGGLLGLGAAISLAPMVTFGSATERYIVDWANLLVLGGMLAVALAFSAYRRLARGALMLAFIAASAWTVFAGVAVSMTGYYDGLRVGQPATYQALEDAFDFVPVLDSRIGGYPILQRTEVKADGTVGVQIAAGRNGDVRAVATYTDPGLATTAGCRLILAADDKGWTRVGMIRGDGRASVRVPLHHGINRLAARITCSGRPASPNGLLIGDLSYN